jgi:hypothetical protein
MVSLRNEYPYVSSDLVIGIKFSYKYKTHVGFLRCEYSDVTSDYISGRTSF